MLVERTMKPMAAMNDDDGAETIAMVSDDDGEHGGEQRRCS